MNWENIIKEDSRFEREKDKIRRRKQRALERRRLKGKAVRGQEKRDMSYFLKRVDKLKKTIKELQTMSKDFDAEKRESMNRTIKGLEKEIEKIMSIALVSNIFTSFPISKSRLFFAKLNCFLASIADIVTN